MRDNNKKVFLGIIVIATLVIAIIGGTFAFFSASGGSANDAVTANATTLANLGFTSSHSKIATNLVPVASENQYFYRYPGIASSGSHSCLDDVGNEICSIYEFTVINTASVAQTIYVSFVPSQNTFDNMYFAAFNTSIASASYVVATGSNGSGNSFSLTPQTTSGNSTLGHQATKLTKNSTDPIDMPGLSTSLGVGESVTYTILVWLQETKNEQNTEQGGQFKAGVNVTTGGNSTGVTGVMEESGNYVYTVSEISTSIGSAIPNGMVTHFTASSAMGGWITENELSSELPFYLKFKMNNDVIEESYVEFVVTSEMVTAASEEFIEYCNENSSEAKCQSPYQGMMAGTYTLKGGDGGASYSTNVSTLTTAFGISNCDDSNPLDFECSFSSLRSDAHDDGYVGAYDDNYSGWSCHIASDNYLICSDR